MSTSPAMILVVAEGFVAVSSASPPFFAGSMSVREAWWRQRWPQRQAIRASHPSIPPSDSQEALLGRPAQLQLPQWQV